MAERPAETKWALEDVDGWLRLYSVVTVEMSLRAGQDAYAGGARGAVVSLFLQNELDKARLIDRSVACGYSLQLSQFCAPFFRTAHT
jgi:hypothetical protein